MQCSSRDHATQLKDVIKNSTESKAQENEHLIGTIRSLNHSTMIYIKYRSFYQQYAIAGHIALIRNSDTSTMENVKDNDHLLMGNDEKISFSILSKFKTIIITFGNALSMYKSKKKSWSESPGYGHGHIMRLVVCKSCSMHCY